MSIDLRDEPLLASGLAKRVLLVEDNDAANRGLTKLLQSQGFVVSAVGNGQDALRCLETTPPHEIVITDLQLPDLDGREVAEFANQLVPRPFILAITGWDIDPEIDLQREWGIDSLLTKPVDIRELLRRLRASC